VTRLHDVIFVTSVFKDVAFGN